MASSRTAAEVPLELEPSTEASKLSSSDNRTYNRLAERMDQFHNYFRQSWNIIYSACAANQRTSGLSIRQFLSTGLNFCRQLDAHHSIEETYVFPMLARKMPEFQKKEHLLEQHREIHDGLDIFQTYLEKCRGGERELRLGELKEIMDGFGKVLWAHLDDEVRALGAENMRKYWTIQDMNEMPI